jgi:MazG family protein
MSDDSRQRATAEFARLLEIVLDLRRRCPWDREQKLEDTGRHLIEEAYEAADAVAAGESEGIIDELGDVIVQTLFAAVIAAESGRFGVGELLAHAARKLVRRHPHVYGDAKAESVDQVLAQWERIKGEEKRTGGGSSKLAGVGRALPALMRAEKLGEKARRAGMDWPGVREVLDKVREELGEAERALEIGDAAHAAEEIGDMMLALANAPRFIGANAEETLRRACDKFIARFEKAQHLAAARGIELGKLSAPELEALWQEAKRTGGR